MLSIDLVWDVKDIWPACGQAWSTAPVVLIVNILSMGCCGHMTGPLLEADEASGMRCWGFWTHFTIPNFLAWIYNFVHGYRIYILIFLDVEGSEHRHAQLFHVNGVSDSYILYLYQAWRRMVLCERNDKKMARARGGIWLPGNFSTYNNSTQSNCQNYRYRGNLGTPLQTQTRQNWTWWSGGGYHISLLLEEVLAFGGCREGKS